MEILNTKKKYDAIIVGSGAAGGMATKILSDAGLNIALIEAGPYFDPADPKQQTQLKWTWESPRRGSSVTRRFGDFHMSYGDWKVDGEPYSSKENTNFMWWRSRMLGGRTNHWGRIASRLGPKDFKCKDSYGIDQNWPISYEDIKPYYDKLDRLIGVFGTKENLPNDPDGFFLPPPKPRLHELYYIKGAKKAGINVIPSRLSVLTKRINNERGLCFYCAGCAKSCNVYGDFSSGSCLIFPAQKSGGQIDLYVNGTNEGNTTTMPNTTNNCEIWIGSSPAPYAKSDTNGYFENVQFLTGIAKYTGNFTVRYENLINGERGLLKYFSLKNLNAQYNEQYMSLKKENEFYLDRIKRLQPNTIDLDYLDETFRKVTGFTSENETVIIIE